MSVATKAVEIEFPFEEFKEAFSLVAKAAPSRSPSPALLSVKLDVADGEAVFMSANLEVWVEHRVPIDYSGPNVSVLLNRATVASILRVATGKTIELEIRDHLLKIRTQSSNWSVPTSEPGYFPVPPELEVSAHHEVESDQFLLAIKRVIREVRGERNNAIEFEPMLTAISLTSNSGSSLANQKVPAAVNGGFEAPAKLPLVPDSAIRLLAGVLAEFEGTVEIAVPNENWCRFRIRNTTIFARQASGTFLRWREHINRLPKPVGKFTAPCGSLRLAVAQASVSLDQISRAMSVEMSEDQMRLQTETANGKSESVAAIEWSGDEYDFRIDPQYLNGMLAAIDDEVPLTVAIHDNLPIKITTEDGFLGFAQPLNREKQDD